jgi:hypothetical protein
MTGELVTAKSGLLEPAGGASGMPSLIARAGGDTENRFLRVLRGADQEPQHPLWR